MPIDIQMPKLSPTMEEGRLARWTVAEGDEVSSGDVIAEVETDKATMEVEALEDGKIAKILVTEGDVKVGEVIGVMAEEGEEVPADYVPGGAADPAPAAEAETPAAPAAVVDKGDAIDVRMPKLSPTMEEGKLARWTVAEGDVVASGDVIAEVETDKATMEVEALEDGIIHKIIIAEGDVKVGTAIGIMVEEGGTVPEGYMPSNEEAKPAKAEEAAPAAPAITEVKKAAPAPAPQKKIEVAKKPQATGAKVSNKLPSQGGAKASPLARKLADELGIDLDYVNGSGPYGRITKADVEAAAVNGNGGAGSSVFKRDVNEMKQIPLTPMRRAIANRLTESKQQTPHFYLSMDVKMDEVLKVRKDLNANADGKFKLTVNDFVVRACALALHDYPQANASWNVDEVIEYGSVDISVAVAIEGGLITPIVFDAENKNIFDTSADVKGLVKQAKEGTLKPEQFQGGGFSISNLGMFGVKNFQAIVNPPQAAILAVGGTEQKVVVENGDMTVASVMNLTLSVDHRVIDGALGAEVLGRIKHYLETPTLLVV
jgi:pyruvate dehydrogenase E2 component (dihydrolipoamide acetyltransferase)